MLFGFPSGYTEVEGGFGGVEAFGASFLTDETNRKKQHMEMDPRVLNGRYLGYMEFKLVK